MKILLLYVVQFLVIRSQQIFAHATSIVIILWAKFKPMLHWIWMKIKWYFNCGITIIGEMGPRHRGPLHNKFFDHNSNSIEISSCSYPSCGWVITVKFCTCHDSCTVMTCAKFHNNNIACNGVTQKLIFHQIWIKIIIINELGPRSYW